MKVIFSTHCSGDRKNHLSDDDKITLCKIENRYPHLIFTGNDYDIEFFKAWAGTDADGTICKTCLKKALNNEELNNE